jgi:hypothetical protein
MDLVSGVWPLIERCMSLIAREREVDLLITEKYSPQIKKNEEKKGVFWLKNDFPHFFTVISSQLPTYNIYLPIYYICTTITPKTHTKTTVCFQSFNKLILQLWFLFVFLPFSQQ